MITLVQRHTVNELERIQKTFLWKDSSPKIKHETLNDYNLYSHILVMTIKVEV